MRKALTAAIVACLAFVNPVAAVGSEATGTVAIQVVRADSGVPVGGAVVGLLGPEALWRRSDGKGVATFDAISAGLYRATITAPELETTTLTLESIAGRDVVAHVALQPTRFLVIGRVKSRPAEDVFEVTDSSASRRVSETLSDALGKIVGVDVSHSSDGPGFNISLHNHDASQTGIQLNGISLGRAASETLRSIGVDFAAGASVSYQADPVSLGGSVNFRTLEPTKKAAVQAAGSFGSYDKSSLQIAVSGTVGRLGYAAQHVDRGGESPLTGLSYADGSGVSYRHDGAQNARTDFVKLRWDAGPATVLSLSGLVGNAEASLVCPRHLTVLPCGWGPRSWQYNQFRYVAAQVQRRASWGSAKLDAVRVDNTNVYDGSGRLLAGRPAPLSARFRGSETHLAGTVNAVARRHAVQLYGEIANVDGGYIPYAGVFSQSYEKYETSRRLKLSDHYTLNDHVVVRAEGTRYRYRGVPPSQQFTAGAAWKPTSRTSVSVDVTAGSVYDVDTVTQPWTDPLSAASYFNCRAGTSQVSAPPDSPRRASYIGESVQFRTSQRRASVQLDLYEQVQHGAAFQGAYPITSADTPAIPDGYVDQLARSWALPSVCGTVSYDPGHTYVNQLVYGLDRLYRGVDASATLRLGKTIVVPSVSASVARLLSANPRFTAPDSYFIVGAQLPGRPLYRAGLTIDTLAFRGVELLGNVQWTGGGNVQNIRPYALTTLGATLPLKYGRVTALVSNVGNVEAPELVTNAISTAIRTVGGGYVILNPAPLPPRQVILLYSVGSVRR